MSVPAAQYTQGAVRLPGVNNDPLYEGDGAKVHVTIRRSPSDQPFPFNASDPIFFGQASSLFRYGPFYTYDPGRPFMVGPTWNALAEGETITVEWQFTVPAWDPAEEAAFFALFAGGVENDPTSPSFGDTFAAWYSRITVMNLSFSSSPVAPPTGPPKLSIRGAATRVHFH